MITPARIPARAHTLVASLLALLLVAGGLTIGTLPANAATGDVTAATLQWGIKQSFRSYIAGPIAHGTTTVGGNVTAVPAFGWTGGTGTASQTGATGSVAYSGTIHFQGHEDVGGIGTGVYGLDLTVSNVRVVKSSATMASVVVDIVSNSLADPATFVESKNVEFAAVDLATATVTSTATAVGYSDAPAVLTEAGAAAFAGFYAGGTALDALTFSWPVEQAPVPAAPAIVVSNTGEISPAGEIVTVTGTGFGPVGTSTNAARPPLAGKFGGVYVAFGRYADAWKPSAGAASSARKNGSVAWVVNPPEVAVIGGAAAGGIAINADGSFTVQLLVSRLAALDSATGNYGIYTYGGGSSNYAPFETYTPITFSTAPTVAVSKTAGISPLGETVTVNGYNFAPVAPASNATRPPLAGTFGGAYVTFGRYADVWRPSTGAASPARKNGSVAWVVNPADVATVGGAAAGAVAINADGTFSVDLLVSRLATLESATGNYGIYTYGGGSSNYAAFETYTPVAFTAAAPTTTTLTATPSAGLVEGGSTTLSAQVAPAAAGSVVFASAGSTLGTVGVDASGLASIPVSGLTAGPQDYTAIFTPAAPLLFAGSTGSVSLTVANKAIGAGSLTWGVKQSFRTYVTGTIAKGSITTSGVGTSGRAYIFGQSAGGTFAPATGLGTSAYSGSVRYTGHGGLLDVTLANPSVLMTSSTQAVLYLSINGAASVPFANLNLLGGTRSTPNNAVAYAGVPATLTSQGAAAFSYNGSSFYTVGEALDPVSFVIGSPSTPAATTSIVAFIAGNTADATPPSTTGVTLADGVDAAALVAGEEYTFEADGFGANESGILAVVYSDPIVLDDAVTADANGVVSWTGTLPADLTGEHTFTFQGSIDRGISVTIASALVTTSALEGCPVEGGTLTWGFKESFRSYISGSIANGEWTVADGAAYETPDFSWTGATGTYDADAASGEIAFPGSVTFTGHDGILTTTVADPRIRVVDADTAFVVLDVAGTTQEGDPVEAASVEFVELDLAAATVETAGDGGVSIAAAPASLTAAGAAAFGTYPSGEEFDPVTVSFASGADCAGVGVQSAAEQPAEAEPVAANTGWAIWIALAAMLLILAIIAAVILARRRTT